MITTAQARIDAQASHASYDDAPVPVGYSRVKELDDPNTGFHAEIYQKTGTNEYIVAFTGTQPSTSQDLVADLALGLPQWRDNKGNVLYAISNLGTVKESPRAYQLSGAVTPIKNHTAIFNF